MLICRRYIFLLLIILNNNAFSQFADNKVFPNPNSKVVWKNGGTGHQNLITSASGEIYGIHNRIIYKQDSSGNTIWAKDFSQPIISISPDSNRFTGIAVNGGKLFVQAMQSSGQVSLGYAYLSVIVMDTAGNLLHLNTYTSYANRDDQLGCFPAFDSGAWYIYQYSGGISNNMIFIKVDTLGNWDSHAIIPNYRYLDAIDLVYVLAVSDSTYRVLVNALSYNLSTIPSFMACSKINDSGYKSWDVTMSDNTFNGVMHWTTASTVAADSLGNTYLFGGYYKEYTTYTTYEYLGVKLDRYGNLIIKKVFPDLNSSYPRFHSASCVNSFVDVNFFYSSNHLGASLRLDSAFHSPCLGIDSTVNLNVIPTFISNGSPYSTGTPVIYTPTPSSGQFSLPVSYSFSDFCTVLNAEFPIPATERISVYPNPTKDEFSILISENDLKIHQVAIYSLSGILLDFFSSPSLQNNNISLNGKDAGIYFLKIETNKGPIVRKLVIQ